jgi:hypothetical protein
MPLEHYEAWAPPGFIWGPWIKIGEIGGSGMIHAYKASFESLSSVKSSFDVEIQYSVGNERKTDRIVGPGSHSFGFGICYCIAQVRLRSHSQGQVIRISVTY